MLLSDRLANSSYFDSFKGGDIILYQHLFFLKNHTETESKTETETETETETNIDTETDTKTETDTEITTETETKTNELVSSTPTPSPTLSSHSLEWKRKGGQDGNNLFNFEAFYQKYSEFYPEQELPTKEFLEWFLGFAEGDGSLGVSSKNSLSFIVSQKSEDVQILDKIATNLGFGKVVVHSVKPISMHKYYVTDRKNLYLLVLLFNGNMILPNRNERLLKLINKLNEKLIRANKDVMPPIKIITKTLPFQLESYWFTGFVDAEGCFTFLISKNTTRILARFGLTQKWENKVLEEILHLFESKYDIRGSVEPLSGEDIWSLRFNHLKNVLRLKAFFEDYPLKSRKKLSFVRFYELCDKLINKEHLDPKLRPGLVELASKVNKFK